MKVGVGARKVSMVGYSHGVSSFAWSVAHGPNCHDLASRL